MNKLYYGDNLDILRRYIADESVDLIYPGAPLETIVAELSEVSSGVQVRSDVETTKKASRVKKSIEQGGLGL